jgi:hypothetical protein
MLSTGEYPVKWGEGIIAPIFKKGNIDDPTNYRGITLINILAKIYSQLLLDRLTTWSKQYDQIHNNQFGFQKGKSIVDCIFILHSVISKVIDSGQKLYCIFIDYQQCFDKIDRTFLWQKLLAKNISSKFVKALKSMYNAVRSCVRYKSKCSDFFISDIGLKQGDPSSPLLFMLFVDDISDNINSDLNDIFTVDEIKLFLILYADDQALFAKSPQALQSMITDLENFCNLWGLKINTSKTKVMIFERGRPTTCDFFIYNTKIETVTYFKYLGITLYKNGSWLRSQKAIAQHASFSLHKLFNLFKDVELPIKQKFKLFDALVASILNFGAEIWGSHEATDIEMVHTKFIRSILCVKKSSNLSALYGETGRLPLVICRKLIMIKYWIKILKQEQSSIVKKVYFMLKDDVDRNRTYNGKNWAYQIKKILDDLGLSYIWYDQSNIEIPLEIIKLRIKDVYLQKWYAEINNSRKLVSYALFKHDFELEKYLLIHLEGKYRISLTKFRISAHNLRIETGRYENTPLENRLCTFCNMRQIENEYHFLLVCPNYRELRTKYFKPYFCHWPNINKFEMLMSSKSNKTVINVAKFIYFASKKRNT